MKKPQTFFADKMEMNQITCLSSKVCVTFEFGVHKDAISVTGVMLCLYIYFIFKTIEKLKKNVHYEKFMKCSLDFKIPIFDKQYIQKI